jgi:hypothetical protein
MHERLDAASTSGMTSTLRSAGVALALTLVTVFACWFAPPAQKGDDVGVSMELPYHVGSLYAFSEGISQAELDILPKDTMYARKSYGSTDSDKLDRITCSIVLSGAERRSLHRPERCLPAQGWRIDNSHTETVSLASGRNLAVTALLLKKQVRQANGMPFTLRQYFLYWYVAHNITTPYQTERILLTNWDLLVHRENQRWAYVYVAANITHDFRPDGPDDAQTLEMLRQFIHDSVPSFMKSEMPGETAAR